MKAIGIIAEYNPFHNGHAYQIRKIKKRTGAAYVAVALSGNFVQRGAPAIVDKYARTAMALHCGADLVIELPVTWAVSSAEAFAWAGITLFEKMGCVDGVCFGAETDDLSMLDRIAGILADEPKAYRDAFAAHIRAGVPFPTARMGALHDVATRKETAGFAESRENSAPHAQSVFSEDELTLALGSPNNILAIEYLKAIKRRKSPLKPLLLKREGAGYHDTALSPLASATAIRHALSLSDVKASFARLDNAMPGSALAVLQDYLLSAPALTSDDFSSALGWRLLSLNRTELAHIYDMTPEIAARLSKNSSRFCSFSQFCALMKSRDITYTRMSRILTHLLLDITDETVALGRSLDAVPYLRILGFRESSTPLLTALKAAATVPVISKLADAGSLLEKSSYRFLEKDIFAAELYAQTQAVKAGRPLPVSEFKRQIVRVKNTTTPAT